MYYCMYVRICTYCTYNTKAALSRTKTGEAQFVGGVMMCEGFIGWLRRAR